MFSKAIVVSIVAHFPVKSAFWLAQPTITMGAFSRKLLSIPLSSFLSPESVTITKRYGCLFPADAERTYDRTLEYFIDVWSKKLGKK